MIRVGARGADSAGYVLFPELRHILQQQKSMSRLMTAPPIMAPGVVRIQWLISSFLASLVIVSSSLIRISVSNLPEIRSQSRSIAVVTYSFSGCWKSWPKVHVQSSHLEWISISLAVVGRNDMVHGSDVTAGIDPDGLT
jgi:hypothetical protein